MAVELVAREQRIPPSRGLVVTHNLRGDALPILDVRRWIRYSRQVLKAEKLDVLAPAAGFGVLGSLLDTADDVGVAMSLRTSALAPPRDLASLKERGLLDVLYCPTDNSASSLASWMDACAACDLPLRVQFQAPLGERFDSEAVARQLSSGGVVRANVALSDPFFDAQASGSPSQSAAELARLRSAVRAFSEVGIESNLLRVPLCLLEEDVLALTANAPQCAADHAHYLEQSVRMAENLYRRRAWVAGKVILILLSRHTFKNQPMDNYLLPMLVRRPYPYMISRVWRRLTNHLRFARSVPKGLQPEMPREREAADLPPEKEADLSATCAACALKRICDHDSEAFRAALPGVAVKAVDGEHVASPLHFSMLQPKYYDVIDRKRVESEEGYASLSEEALDLLASREPDAVVGPHDYGVEETFFDRMESGLKWWSVSNIEKLSTPLGTFGLPLAMSVDVGAGIADYVGFSFGRHCKVMCRMEAYRHNITLYVNTEGRYILLRDRQPVRPAEFEGRHYLPLRLGNRLTPRITIWNIDECIATQNLRVWSGEAPETAAAPKAKYSIIIVSTRFTRRLHAVLRSLAHQQGIDFAQVEVIICYVPGLDATDDLIDGMTMTYPELRVVRSPFPEHFMNSKGFLINESRKIASGDWIMLLDSDTLLPPDYLAKVEAASADAEFIAPDGRKLLPKDLTAKVLMGEIDPWNRWEELLEGAGEFRHRETRGIPVGFCQCFRANYLDEFPYMEVDHFETADMQFGELMRKHVGQEHRLSGTPVIHLDHGGSQWYGTQKHM